MVVVARRGQHRWRRDLLTPILYVLVILRKFRWTLLLLFVAVVLGGALFATTPHAALGGRPPQPLHAFLAAWLALFGEQVFSPPATWQLAVLAAVYPLLGFGLIGEGIVRVGMLIVARDRKEKEWMMVQASTYRDHVILCGLGNLGFRILSQLVERGTPAVAIERNGAARFVADAMATGTPVLIRDMKEDQALLDAGIRHASVIIIASNDDLANLEVALDARRMNPSIRVVVRMFDQQIADKFKQAAIFDEAFSSTALAAPVVVDLALDDTRPSPPATS